MDKATSSPSTSEPRTRAEADRLIAELRSSNGGISEEARANTPAETLRALENLKSQFSSMAVKLSADLYSSDSHFLYELIQNADDNFYSKATERGEQPELTIAFHNNQIIVSSNEDGFTESNVKAICKAGESTKNKMLGQGYIGEKGIGFKSVFKIADRVHIKSEPYSFSFHYKRNSKESGLEMVTPLPESHDNMPTCGSRIILSQLRNADSDKMKRDFEEIPEALLLFLRKLKVLIIRYSIEAQTTETRYCLQEDFYRGYRAIKIETSRYLDDRSSFEDGQTSQKLLNFFVAQSEVNDLPEDERRKTSDGNCITSATPMLAFPLDEMYEPIFEEQFAYAFLPLRKFGFMFLIQADFVTQSSREDALHSSSRNRALLSKLAELFCEAILKLCDHPPLQYTWMRYLPQLTVLSDFWKDLRPEIIRRISELCVVRSWTHGKLCCPRQLRRLPDWMQDSTGQPLLDDLASNERYLSQEYLEQDWEMLQGLGTGLMSSNDFLELLHSDLQASERPSKWKDLQREADWQKRTSQVLLDILHENSKSAAWLRTMSLVPLQTDEWVAVGSQKIFMPNSGSIPVPTNLSIKLVNPEGVEDDTRKKLYFALGVRNCDPKDIVRAIYDRYKFKMPAKTLGVIISHFVYLFWNVPKEPLELPRNVRLVDESITFRARSMAIYFRNPEHRFGPEQLFQPITIGEQQAPGHTVHFLHPSLLSAVSSSARRHDRTWRMWLESALGVRNMPHLVEESPSGPSITSDFGYIMEHRSEMLVPLLKHYKSHYLPIPVNVLSELSKTEVPTRDGNKTALRMAFLPTTKLRKIAEDLDISTLPFLALDQDITEEAETEWAFVKQFNVDMENTLRFYLSCLASIITKAAVVGTPGIDSAEVEDCRCKGSTSDDHAKGAVFGEQRSVRNAFQVYRAIEAMYKHEDKSLLQAFCENLNCMCIPNSGGPAKWVEREECVWEGPSWLRCKHVLPDIPEYKSLEYFCCSVMGIKNATWEDSLEELKNMKDEHISDFPKVCDIYKSLWREFGHDDKGNFLRNEFESLQLVYTESDGWVRPSDCVWASRRVQIMGKTSISAIYGSCEDFFRNTLGVPKPSLQMHIKALKALAKSIAAVPKIKEAMEQISQMGPLKDSLRSEFANLSMFPVRVTNGTRQLAMSTADFAIVDRPRHENIFEGKINILDFTMEEVRLTQPFLEACGLRNRFTSACVEENTMAEDHIQSFELTQQLRSNAYAFVRFAVHFRSNRVIEGHQELYACLQTLSVYRSDKISKTLTIQQYSNTVTIPQSTADLHFEDGEELCIYVPKQDSAFKRCWPQQITPKFSSWLGVNDKAAEAVLQIVFIRGEDLETLDSILEHEGIMRVEGVQRPERANGSSCDSERDSNTEAYTPVDRTINLSQDTGIIVASGGMKRTSPPTFTPGPSAQEIAFRAILDDIIKAWKVDWLPHRLAQVPRSVSSFRSRAQAQIAFGLANINGFRNVDRDRKVGAAGELYICGVLYHLGLSDFNASNWQSSIRDEVRVHEAYKDLAPWLGRETSDIVYEDTRSKLTAVLIDKGYLIRSIWQGKTPKYYIEVKTTTEQWDEPFYVSASQYERMKRAKLPKDRAAPEVYMIIRVFNLAREDEDIGLRVYLDPYSAQESGELVFSSRQWTVTPGRLPS